MNPSTNHSMQPMHLSKKLIKGFIVGASALIMICGLICVLGHKQYLITLRTKAMLPSGEAAAYTMLSVDNRPASEVKKGRYISENMELAAGRHQVVVEMWDHLGAYGERTYNLDVRPKQVSFNNNNIQRGIK